MDTADLHDDTITLWELQWQKQRTCGSFSSCSTGFQTPHLNHITFNVPHPDPYGKVCQSFEISKFRFGMNESSNLVKIYPTVFYKKPKNQCTLHVINTAPSLFYLFFWTIYPLMKNYARTERRQEGVTEKKREVRKWWNLILLWAARPHLAGEVRVATLPPPCSTRQNWRVSEWSQYECLWSKKKKKKRNPCNVRNGPLTQTFVYFRQRIWKWITYRPAIVCQCENFHRLLCLWVGGGKITCLWSKSQHSEDHWGDPPNNQLGQLWNCLNC